MKILALDIETSPNLVYTWGLFDQNVGLNQVVDTTRILCFAAQWIGDDTGGYPFGQKPKKGVVFYSEGTHHQTSAVPAGKAPRRRMLEAAHQMIDEADVVLHYNGTTFDMPHLSREFLEAGMAPPSPYAQIDLYRVVKGQFKFQSKRLEHVSRQLGLAGKVDNGGFDLWTRVMAGEWSAWKEMEKYNRQDVTLLDELYEILLPWIPNHPSVPLHADHAAGLACPRCGSTDLERRGYAYTRVSVFQQYQCRACRGWFRGAQKVNRTVGR
jgi:hypothetical protein